MDACQLLGLDRTFKYQQARTETLARCIDFCENRASEFVLADRCSFFSSATKPATSHWVRAS
jgi:serine/threonine-protein kinase HipA